MPITRSSLDQRNNYNEISELCHAVSEPVFLTNMGTIDLAIMSIETYSEELFNLACMHSVRGVGENKKYAVELWTKVSELGNSKAQIELAYCYKNGIGGLKQDLNKAKELYLKAIALGNERAKVLLEKLEKMRN